jgi:hypothetical protein
VAANAGEAISGGTNATASSSAQREIRQHAIRQRAIRQRAIRWTSRMISSLSASWS